MAEPDAEYYQAHKDDPEEWGEPESVEKPKNRRLAAMISVRFAPEEEAAVRQAAATRGESVSHFIRQAALRDARSTGARGRLTMLPSAPTASTSSTLASTEVLACNSLIQLGAGRTRAHARPSNRDRDDAARPQGEARRA
jgi:uncharacterized protein (DUF1778 family)